MHVRTRYRLGMIPVLFLLLTAAPLPVLYLFPTALEWLGSEAAVPNWVAWLVACLAPVPVVCWYLLTFAEVGRGRLRLRSLRGEVVVDLRRLEQFELVSLGRGRKGRARLLVRLVDASGAEACLPLSTWRDEDLIVAVLLRATVDRRIRIAGEEPVVESFSGLLDTYRSWDRQQAA